MINAVVISTAIRRRSYMPNTNILRIINIF
jgi:hypothetical protein